MPTGRTKPLLLECAHVDGDTERRCRYVVKAIGLPEVFDFTLCHELIGCRLARLFGLAAPNSALVNLTPQFLDAVGDDLERAGLQPIPGLAVGVEHVRNLYAFPASPTLGENEIVEAARIYAFDLATQNPDRTARWPNCGRAPDGLVPYDFENAFSFRFALLKPEPWEASRLGFAKQHLFHGQLSSADVDWASVFGPMAAAGIKPIETVCGTIPDSWRPIGDDIGTTWPNSSRTGQILNVKSGQPSHEQSIFVRRASCDSRYWRR